jgi:hypothetical protein
MQLRASFLKRFFAVSYCVGRTEAEERFVMERDGLDALSNDDDSEDKEGGEFEGDRASGGPGDDDPSLVFNPRY